MKFPFSQRRWIQTTSKTDSEPLATKNRLSFHSQWIIARSLCLYKTFDLRNIPPRQRAAALAIRIRQCSPWKNHGSCSLFAGHLAQVWLWDEDARLHAVTTAAAGRTRPLPESLLQPEPNHNGPLLRPCLEGWDLQFRDKGQLVFSRWYQKPPDKTHCHRILLAADLAASDVPIPTIERQPLLSAPWKKPSTAGTPTGTGREERAEHYAWPLLCAVAAFTFSWITFHNWQLDNKINTARARAKHLEKTLQPVLTARAAMAADRQYIEDALSQHLLPPLTTLFAALLPVLADNDAVLIAWHWQQPAFTLELEGKKTDKETKPARLDAPKIIAAFEQSPLFTDVSATAGKDEFSLTLTMVAIPEKSQATQQRPALRQTTAQGVAQ